MVCARCISAVKNILDHNNLEYNTISLGEINLKNDLAQNDFQILNNDLKEIGFEIIEDEKQMTVNQIKNLLLEYLAESTPYKLSNFLSERLEANYNLLSQTFAIAENTTIEKYFILLRIEKVKEHLSYNDSLKEIANKFNFSSTAHLSKQFKEVVGISASEYKNQKSKLRKHLDKI